MKKLLTACSLTLLCSVLINARISNFDTVVDIPDSRCTVPKTATAERELDCLKGNVHTVKSEFATFVKKDGQFVKTAVSQELILTYDKQGNIIERVTRGSKDYGTESFMQREVFNFNSQGVATGSEGYNSASPLPVKVVYTYNDKGQRIKQTVTYLQFNVLSILTFVYNSAGNKIEERSYYPVPIVKDIEPTPAFIEKYLDGLTKFKYDGKNLIQTINYNKEGLITYNGIFTYKNGNQKEATYYSLDAKGNLVRTNRTSFKYDAKGNRIEKVIYNNDDSIQARYVDDFDERGYRISRIIYDSNGKITSKGSLTYEFDSHGNWLSYKSDDLIVLQRINAGEPFPRELRTITYY